MVSATYESFFHSRKRHKSPVRWDDASEKFKETVETRPSSVVGCNSYGLIFPFRLRERPRAARERIAHKSPTSPAENRTQPGLGVIQGYRNGNE